MFKRRELLGLGAVSLLPVGAVKVAQAEFTGFDQDFESLAPGEYPSGWKKDGSDTQEVVDGVANSGDQSLKAKGSHGGCWEALASAPLGGYPGEQKIRFTGSILPGDEGSFGCHDSFYAQLQLRTSAGNGWSDGLSKVLIDFSSDETVYGSGGVEIGGFSPGEWVSYDVTYEYDSSDETVTLEYSINGGADEASTTVDAADWETNIAYLTLRSGDFTAYWDNVSVSQVNNDNTVPTSEFQYTPENPTPAEEITFDASGSNDPDGSITGYSWDLNGDGSYTKSGETVSHEYDDSGEYSVSLRVTDNDGATDVSSKTVSVESPDQDPIARVETSSRSVEVREDITFDASESKDPDGQIEQYRWDFADGTTETAGETVKHAYDSPGEYNVRLTVTDTDGNSDSTGTTVSVSRGNEKPSVSLDVESDNPVVGTTVTFDGSQSSDPDGSISAYQWDFNGDGTQDATGQQVEYTYEDPGNYTVTLTVVDNEGASVTRERQITVDEPENKPPTARFDVSTSSPRVGDPIRFDATTSTDPDGTIEEYRWDFNGDGTRDTTGRRVEHAYDSPGEYTITLTVVDDEGETSSSRGQVTVSESPLVQIAAEHLETANRVDNISVSDLNATAKAKNSNEQILSAVERGELDQTTAFETIQRLNSGLRITELTVEHISSAKEFQSDQVDLTREMSGPAINTSISLLTAAYATSKRLSKGAGIGASAILNQAKGLANSAAKEVVYGTYGKQIDVMSNLTYETNTIVGKLFSGYVDTVAALEREIDQISKEIIDVVSVGVQYQAETGFAAGVAPLSGTYMEGYAISLAAGLQAFYEYFSVERIVEDGLPGDTNAAMSAGVTASQSIASEAEDTQRIISDTKEFSQSFSLTESIFRLWDDPSLIEVGKTILSTLLFVAGGITDAFATGSGIGAILKINTTHHVGLFNIIRG